ncbi:uncharacterized protein LOC110875870 [Helianthus annuus]|uniref:uncharacterized protein LOC110875870 n=1 Tax=Helianthus annuus TaxID=4232 RepID=UPI000B9073D1|nr:uncharacterized protein LOC110875870 [Helianthus annuus]
MGIEKDFEMTNLSLNKYLIANIGNGCKAKFCLDTWVGNGPLKERFPALYALARNNNCKVSEFWRRIGEIEMWDWVWHRGIRNDEERDQHLELIEVLKDQRLKESEDTWKWKTRPNEEMTVAMDTAKSELVRMESYKKRIPDKVELNCRGINIEDLLCSRCERDEEWTEHLLLKCVLARATWWNIMAWLKLPNHEEHNSCEEMMQHIQEQNCSKDWKQLITAIIMITMWQIWKSRNELIFKGLNGSVTRTVDEIKELSFLWIKERSKLKNLDWERWKDFNIRDIIK